jgi:hypothetical protein
MHQPNFQIQPPAPKRRSKPLPHIVQVALLGSSMVVIASFLISWL